MNRAEEDRNKNLMVVQSTKYAGDTFGELALKIDRVNPKKVIKRAATVSTKEDSIFAVIDKTNYRHVLDKVEFRNDESLIDFFSKIPFVRALSKKAIKDLHLFMEPMKYHLN